MQFTNNNYYTVVIIAAVDFKLWTQMDPQLSYFIKANHEILWNLTISLFYFHISNHLKG